MTTIRSECAEDVGAVQEINLQAFEGAEEADIIRSINEQDVQGFLFTMMGGSAEESEWFNGEYRFLSTAARLIEVRSKVGLSTLGSFEEKKELLLERIQALREPS